MRTHPPSTAESPVPAATLCPSPAQDRVRALHREVLRLASLLHPPARVVDYLAQGLASKSNRTKIECCGEGGAGGAQQPLVQASRRTTGTPVLAGRMPAVLAPRRQAAQVPSPRRAPNAATEEISAIIEREGMAPIHGARCKPAPMVAIAALLKERDGATRAAALGAIEQAWAEEGEGVFKLLGRWVGRGPCGQTGPRGGQVSVARWWLAWQLTRALRLCHMAALFLLLLVIRLETREQDMVQEKLKRSSKQPRVAPVDAAPAAAAPARHRPGAFVPREPAGTPPGHIAAMLARTSDGEAGQPDAAYGVAQQYSEEGLQYTRPAFTPPNALATPLPHRPATSYLPPGAAAAASVAPTPVPGARPYTAPGEDTGQGQRQGNGRQECSAGRLSQGAKSCLLSAWLCTHPRLCQPTPRLRRLPPGRTVGAAPVVVDDADFDARWADSMAGITSDNVDEAVEHMKLM